MVLWKVFVNAHPFQACRVRYRGAGMILIAYQGIARTQSPPNKNCAPESSTFGMIARVNPTVVQWRGLALGEPPSRSRSPLCQVSMLRNVRLALVLNMTNIQKRCLLSIFIHLSSKRNSMILFLQKINRPIICSIIQNYKTG